jgi:outer membrane receptor protein involved in Fe transport
MKKVCFVVLVSLAFLFPAATGASAQSTAQISGTASDPSGAILPGVEVTATQTDTGLSRTAVTNETGLYVLPNLPVGPYRLEASLPGFRTYAQTGIVLAVGANPVINVSLEIGQVSETIEVQADAALVETRNTGVGQVIDNVRVLELPLNGRNVQDLIILSGMAVGGGNQASQRNYPTDIISVGGGLNDALTYLLDGGTHNEPYANANLPLPFPDAVQEFKVETSAVPAQYGQHSAGAINVITKSGTNEFHGNLFEFVRNKVFNARNAFAAERDGLKRNQFGGTIGGPIVENKLFFFAGMQTTLQRSQPTDTTAFVPTPAMLAGDWTAVSGPNCNGGRTIQLRAPFVNNRIDPALFSRVAVNLTKWFPTPVDECGRAVFGRRNNSDEHIIVGRVDFQKSQQHSIFGRYELARLDAPSNYDGKNWLSVSTADYERRAQSFVLGDTYLIGSNMVSSFRGTVFYSPNPKTLKTDFFTWSDLGVRNVWYPEGFPRFALVNLQGSFSTSQVPTPGKTNTQGHQLAEDLTMTRGNHQIGFGANHIHTLMNYSAATFTPIQFTFNGSNVGTPMADLMMGRPSSFQQSQPSTQYYRQNYFGFYLQDTWKATPNLTLNAGVRYEPYIPPYDKFGPIANFKQEWFDQGLRSTIFRNAPAGLLFTGEHGIEDTTSLGNKEWFPRLAPRLGISYDPGGDGLTVIRASYGIFFDYPHMSLYSGLRDTPPRGARVSVSNPAGGLDDPYAGIGNPFPIVVDENVAFPLRGTYTILPRDLKNTYINQWNLTVQRQFAQNWLVSASYIGNNVIHMWYQHEENPGIYIPGQSTTGNLNNRRKLTLQNPAQGQYYSFIVMADADSTRNYNAMSLALQKRQSNGITIQGNYTWSHCIDNGYSDVIQTNGIMIPERRGANRGNCDLDRRHNFNMSTVYETPQFANSAVRWLAGGWRVSGIVRLISGAQLTVSSGVDQAMSGTTDQTPDQILASPYPDQKTLTTWLNPAAFALPAIGSYGNVGQRTVRGPGTIRIDMAATRSFAVGEGKSVEFRAEAFNMPNHMNPGNPNTVFSSQTFGRITSAGDPRIMQLALKYVF